MSGNGLMWTGNDLRVVGADKCALVDIGSREEVSRNVCMAAVFSRRIIVPYGIKGRPRLESGTDD